MGDPTRLLSAHSDAETLERVLLESLAPVPPEGAAERDAIWSALAVQLAGAAALGVAAGAGSTAASASAASAVVGAGTVSAAPPALAAGAKLAGSGALGGLSALLPKTLIAKLIVVSALGGAGGTAVWLQRPSSRPSIATMPTQPAANVPPASRSSQPSAGPQAALADGVQAPAAAAPRSIGRPHQGGAGATRGSGSVRQATRQDRLTRESQLLTSARASLREGNLSVAAGLLRRLEREFAVGELQQEREVLQIELLSARGEVGAAAQRARRFVAAHPESPHSATLARFLR